MRTYQRLFIPTAIILLAYAALPTPVVQTVRDRATTAVAPAGHWLTAHNGAVQRWYRSLRQLSTLRRDKERLQQQVVFLEQRLTDQERIRQENAALHEQLNIPLHEPKLPERMGAIILRGNDPLNQTYVIDIGTDEGIREGQAALSQGYLVGRVVEAREHTSVIRSVTSRDSIIQAWTTEGHAKGLLIGDGNTVYLSEVEQGLGVQDHALVETSGLGKSLPQGLMIGSVRERTSKPSELSQRFAITQPIDTAAMNTLFIVITSDL